VSPLGFSKERRRRRRIREREKRGGPEGLPWDFKKREDIKEEEREELEY
jgi:hypothetical protein